MAKINKGDFGNGSIVKILLRMSVPIMIGEFVHVLYNIVDRIYIGHMEGVGTIALTGVGIAFPLITFIGAFANWISIGGGPLASMARGEGDNERSQRIMETSFAALIYIGIILTVVLYVFAPQLLKLFGGDEETLPYALSYFKIYVLGTIPVMISLGMNTFITSQGFSGMGMWSVIIGAVINIVLDPILIFNCNMGIAGAAVATVVSQLASAVWIVVFLCSNKPIVPLRHFRIYPVELPGIIKLGVTGFTFKVTNSITQAVVNITLKAFGGVASTLYIGAMSVINSLREITSIPVNGMVNGYQPVLSYNYGAKDDERVNECFNAVLKISAVINVAIWLIMMFFPKPLISLFTEDAELIGITIRCSKIYFMVFFMMAFQLVGQNSFVALNMPNYSIFFSLLRKIVLIVPFTLILPRIGLGAEGVFYAEALSQLLGSMATFVTFYAVVWSPLLKKLRKKNEIQTK